MQQYVKYLSLCDNVKGPSDLTARGLLDWLVPHWANSKSPGVIYTIERCPLASTTTLHRKLVDLEADGYINIELAKTSKRLKQIEPTRKTIDYYATLERAMESACAAP